MDLIRFWRAKGVQFGLILLALAFGVYLVRSLELFTGRHSFELMLSFAFAGALVTLVAFLRDVAVVRHADHHTWSEFEHHAWVNGMHNDDLERAQKLTVDADHVWFWTGGRDESHA